MSSSIFANEFLLKLKQQLLLKDPLNLLMDSLLEFRTVQFRSTCPANYTRSQKQSVKTEESACLLHLMLTHECNCSVERLFCCVTAEKMDVSYRQRNLEVARVK